MVTGHFQGELPRIWHIVTCSPTKHFAALATFDEVGGIPILQVQGGPFRSALAALDWIRKQQDPAPALKLVRPPRT